jgi:hypothetical protein
LNVFEDNGETKAVSQFENSIPVRFVTLTEFDKPLTKMQAEGLKTISLKELVEAFEK